MINNELLNLLGFLSGKALWLYFIIIIIGFYALIAIITWNIKKPLIFLGIPTILVGIFVIIFRFLIDLIISNKNLLTLFNSIVKPLFQAGLTCIIVGIVMIIIYKLLNIKNNNSEN